MASNFPGFTIILQPFNHLIARLLSDSKRCIKFWMLIAKAANVLSSAKLSRFALSINVKK